MSQDIDNRLRSLRDELDEIDRRLLESIRDRIDVCARVAHVKRAFDIPMMQPARVGVVQERARVFARAHDLSEEFLVSVYSTLIAEACRVEDAIIESEPAVSRTASNTQRR
ncbi:chorismate mutase [Rhodococcoides yunnanense]|uniref:chorismate mutase n=1 Tax=Rhodococcoides yunnanense TaxID=278209 RepID=UPI0009327BF1|nr:chorismate mutase [Rhodococcus yunnanensis]